MTAVTPKRFTIEEYHRLGDFGFFQSGDINSESLIDSSN